MKGRRPFLLALTLLGTMLITSVARGSDGSRGQAIYDGPEIDYQPAILRVEPSNDLMIVFERLPPSWVGDLYVTFSKDNGLTWTTPQPAINSSLNERHPALVQAGLGSFLLFYLVDHTGSGSYRIHRATSPDGIYWTDQGALDLGWTSPGEINPNVIREADGSLTMTYHRLSGSAYIARSLDDGVTWDKLMTKVSNGKGALPRLAKRESDGRYLVTYQIGSSSVDILAKTTLDPYNWPNVETPLSTQINSHDSQPIVLEGGTFLVTYAQQVASVFDLYYKTSYDGKTWSMPMRLTFDTSHYDTQPHPLRQGTAGHIILTWSHQESPQPYVDHDVWIDADVPVPLPLWLDQDKLSAASGGQVQFSLDFSAAFAGRDYFLLGTLSGTTPGTLLPGGLTLPVNLDLFSTFILMYYNTPLFDDFMGTLDGNGQASATLSAPGAIPLALGTTMHFASMTLKPFDFVSNPQGVVIAP